MSDKEREMSRLKEMGFTRPDLKFKDYYSCPISFTSQFYFCPVPLRMDTYSGCQHGCIYCFANNSLQKVMNSDSSCEKLCESRGVKPTRFRYVKKYFDIAFEGAPNTFSEQEAVAVDCLKKRVPLHFGGMSDPFQPMESILGITYRTLELLKKYNYPVIISTKGSLALDERYVELLRDYENVMIQVSLIDDREEVIKELEPSASTVEERLKIIKTYSDMGKRTACRIQPFIISLSEDRIVPLLDKLKANGCYHVMVEGLKFFSSNLKANDRISKAFKNLTGKSFDLTSYYKAIGAKCSGNDIELPTWRKYRYAKIFKEEIAKRGMTFGAADNDLRFLGDTPCCCGCEGLKGFENMIKHNTGFAIFNCLRKGKKGFNYDDIKDFWFPKGTFRLVMSKENIIKKHGYFSNDLTKQDIGWMFKKAWDKGKKNSPCDQCCVCIRKGEYKLKSEDELDKELKDRGEQETLF